MFVVAAAAAATHLGAIYLKVTYTVVLGTCEGSLDAQAVRPTGSILGLK